MVQTTQVWIHVGQKSSQIGILFKIFSKTTAWSIYLSIKSSALKRLIALSKPCIIN